MDEFYASTQKYLGKKGLMVFLILMNMLIPLSTDLNLPALPKMSGYFGCNVAATNLTLSVFFIFYAFATLVWGPLSDKYGRKPVIMVGSIVFIFSSTACALSTSIYFLIAARLFQGIGAGGITAASITIIKDCFTGKKRETVLAVAQSAAMLAPMLAPIIGAWILKFANWKGTFWALAAIGAINLLLTILYKETLRDDERYRGTVIGSMNRLIVVGKNPSFMVPTIIFSSSALSMLGYIAISSYIYVDYFGLSEQVFSYYFAANALVSIIGPIIYIRFFTGFNKSMLTNVCFGLAACSGILVMTVGTLSPVLFMIPIIIMSLTSTFLRPFSTNLLLEQQKGDTGSMSSIINTCFTLFGSLGMALASMPWGNIVVGLGVLIILASSVSIISWHLFIKSSIPCVGLKE